ncbi:Cell wall alpha-1,3-glucan synthase ags1 [Puccinia graminis f. sp. tritici]|uniref:Cell wall alpha-1,3-glucan synthase ags1 n=1 Tax=Puccinia graminis f. sp. tritici TaxID=56615 RepID=A0A5B0M7E9_PUCGR|nr:Cell wall alpha-1,3-glucan synthase ags1 [Puccinia graminis f. sp. tritici]
MPWQADGYSALDFTLLDPHYGTLAEWRAAIDKIHARGILQGYEVEWKYPPHTPWDLQRYADFNFTNTRSTYGCYAGDFDQFGDIEAFGVHPDWQRQLSKFASVQDRLREWDGVAAKLEHLACMTLKALDPDSIRIDKATQQTVDFVGKWGAREGTLFGSLYIGRGRQPKNYANIGVQEASLIQANQSQHFMRPVGQNGLDSAAFHYSVYRSLTRFLSMDGNLDVAYDVEVNWASAWNQIFVSNDFLNHHTGQIDPRHLYGTSNQDVFRWPSLKNGTAKLLLGQLITNLVMPGIPLAYYGEEQDMYLYDSQAIIFTAVKQCQLPEPGKQHGCYRVGSQQYYKNASREGTYWMSRRVEQLGSFRPHLAQCGRCCRTLHILRAQYPALQDGFNLAQRGNWTSFGQLPGSNMTQTEWGFWSVTRSPSDQQQFTGPNGNTTVWMLYK